MDPMGYGKSPFSIANCNKLPEATRFITFLRGLQGAVARDARAARAADSADRWPAAQTRRPMLCLRVFSRHHILVNTNKDPRPWILKWWRYWHWNFYAPKRISSPFFPDKAIFLLTFFYNAILLSLQARYVFNSVDNPPSVTIGVKVD